MKNEMPPTEPSHAEKASDRNALKGEAAKPNIVEIDVDKYCEETHRDAVEEMLSMAQDPLESILLEQAKYFHRHFREAMRTAFKTVDPYHAQKFEEQGARLSDQVLKINEAIRKHRGRGEQKVIVEHHRSASADRVERGVPAGERTRDAMRRRRVRLG
jgi:hypothetical protein